MSALDNSSTFQAVDVSFVQPLKGRKQCFSIQVVNEQGIPLNPDKKLAQIRLVVFEKNTKKRTL